MTEENFHCMPDNEQPQKSKAEKAEIKKTERNLDLISEFSEHCKVYDVVIPESVIESFFNA